MIKKCPCRYCDKRTIDCHGKCKEYKSWFKENEALRKKIHYRLNSDRYAIEDIASKSIKSKKRRGKIK